MVLFTSEMHLFTSVFVIMELMILTFQLFYFYSRPQDRKRLWFLILLVLLIFYNLSTGLIFAESFGLSVLPNMFAYGSGFVLAAYLPWYCYKAFEFSMLRFHVRYGVGLFLILPYLIFFAVVYPMTADLAFSLKWGMMVPFVYSLVLVWVLLSATLSKVVLKVVSYSRIEMCTVCLAVVPWIFIAVFSVLPIPHWVRALMANFGVVIVSVMYMVRSVEQNRVEHAKLLALDLAVGLSFEKSCHRFRLTDREVEIAVLLSRGLTYQQIAALLFIAGKTVDRHVQNIFLKAGVRSRMELLMLLGFSSRAAAVGSTVLKDFNRVAYESDI